MASIVNTNLAGSTITYNGVQFGGADAAFKSVPPEYSVQGSMVYDEAGRAVTGVEYTLTVRTKFYESSEDALSTNADAVKSRLSTPGKELKIEGIGVGFGTIRNDLKYGPQPVSCEWQPLGQLMWELIWTVRFFVSECGSANAPALAWMAWNYDTTWQNDFEGTTARTISGYVEIAGKRNPANPKMITAVADQCRDNIQIITPPYFKRTNNVWKEDFSKRRIDFVVVDEQLPGDSFPPGITQAGGHCDFSSVGPGFAKSTVNIGLSLKVAPGVAPGVAGTMIINAMIAKMNAMQRRNPRGTVIPRGFSLRNRKYDESRITEGQASFEMTQCLSAMLNAAGIWEPLTDGNYQQWRTSVEKLWGNRGVSNLGTRLTDDVILDICDNVTQKTWGSSEVTRPFVDDKTKFSFACPEIPPDGGWIGYDVQARLLRKDKQSLHRKALSYVPSPIPAQSDSAGNPVTLATADPGYTQSATDEHVTEHHGYPETYVLMQFKGLRAKWIPTVPNITSVQGKKVVLQNSHTTAPKIAFDIFECPAYFVQAWKLYVIKGPVDTLKVQGSKTSCAKSTVISDY
jgi:hypothetical protein